MKPISIAMSLTVAIAVAMTATATAKPKTVDAHLKGKANVNIAVYDDTLNPGEVVKGKRTYKFKPTCRGGSCPTVKVWRSSSTGKMIGPFTLKRVGVGRYEGTFINQNYVRCYEADETLYEVRGRQDETLTIKIQKKSKKTGRATKFSGTLELLLPALTAPITPPICEEKFAALGLGVGDRPHQRARFSGKFKK